MHSELETNIVQPSRDDTFVYPQKNTQGNNPASNKEEQKRPIVTNSEGAKSSLSSKTMKVLKPSSAVYTIPQKTREESLEHLERLATCGDFNARTSLDNLLNETEDKFIKDYTRNLLKFDLPHDFFY